MKISNVPFDVSIVTPKYYLFQVYRLKKINLEEIECSDQMSFWLWFGFDSTVWKNYKTKSYVTFEILERSEFEPTRFSFVIMLYKMLQVQLLTYPFVTQ